MKYEKIIYVISTLLILGAGVMILMHIKIGNLILILTLVGMSIYQTYHIEQLKKKINKFENK